MKVQLTTPRVDAFGSYLDGAVIDVPPDEAGRMIAAGQATAVKALRAETAVAGPAENAARKAPTRK